MKRLLRFVSFVIVIAFSMQPASATTLSPNFTDLWWNPAESGWGVNVDQQGDVIFATFFVYSELGEPVWYAAVLFLQGTSADGTTNFAGDLFETTGPWFAGAYNRAAVVQRKVGSARLQGTTHAAVLTYSVDTNLVVKQIVRQTLRDNSLVGTYLGATSDVTFGCSPPSRNGIKTDDVGAITVVQAADVVTIFAPTCRFTGTYVQQGQTGRIDNGTYVCSNGAQGTLTFSDLYVEQSGLIGKYVGRDNSCSFSGTIGGARRQ